MTTSKEQCTFQQMKYHAMFPDIPTMTSEDWITRTNQDKPDVSYILVDVRSKEERTVSIIPQSVTLKQFERELEQAIQKGSSSSIAASQSSTIINANVVRLKINKLKTERKWTTFVLKLFALTSFTYFYILFPCFVISF
jgi:hypothetical protein